LSIWTHGLKSFEYLPTFNNTFYNGPAAKVGAGVQSYDLYNIMAAKNITIVAPGYAFS